MKPLIGLLIAGAAVIGVSVGMMLPHPAPQACIDANNHAEQSLKYAGEVITLTSETMSDISALNFRNVQKGTDRINAINPELQKSLQGFKDNKEQCK